MQRILLVDDSEVLRKRLARAFADRGLVVDTAADYDQAIRCVEQAMPDLAVVDLRMPGRSGMELVRELKLRSASIQILVLTGFGSIATAIEAIRLGAINFLPKPADADDILAAFGDRQGGDEQGDVALDHEAPSLARVEWEHIHRVLAECEGNISEAARRLGIHRRSLQRKLRKRAPD